jgi:hypothetical protein
MLRGRRSNVTVRFIQHQHLNYLCLHDLSERTYGWVPDLKLALHGVVEESTFATTRLPLWTGK